MFLFFAISMNRREQSRNDDGEHQKILETKKLLNDDHRWKLLTLNNIFLSLSWRSWFDESCCAIVAITHWKFTFYTQKCSAKSKNHRKTNLNWSSTLMDLKKAFPLRQCCANYATAPKTDTISFMLQINDFVLFLRNTCSYRACNEIFIGFGVLFNHEEMIRMRRVA